MTKPSRLAHSSGSGSRLQGLHNSQTKAINIYLVYLSGQISIIPKPELRGFWGSSLIKPPFRVTSADVVIICPDLYIYINGKKSCQLGDGICYRSHPKLQKWFMSSWCCGSGRGKAQVRCIRYKMYKCQGLKLPVSFSV